METCICIYCATTFEANGLTKTCPKGHNAQPLSETEEEETLLLRVYIQSLEEELATLKQGLKAL